MISSRSLSPSDRLRLCLNAVSVAFHRIAPFPLLLPAFIYAVETCLTWRIDWLYFIYMVVYYCCSGERLWYHRFYV